MNIILSIIFTCLLFFTAGLFGFKTLRGRRRKKFLGFAALLFLCAVSFLLSSGDERSLQADRLSGYGKSFLSEYFPQALPLANEALQEQSALQGEEISAERGVNKESSDVQDAQSARESGEVRVDFLDVGQGLSVLVRSGGQCLLYDGGGRSTSSFLVAYLKEQGIQKIDYVVASHYDSDHLSGLNGVLNVFDVGRILGPDYEADTAIYKSFVKYAGEKQKEIVHPMPGDVFSLGDASFTVLAPEKADSEDDNNSSLVLRIQNGRNAFLLMGDTENKGEEALLETGFDLSCDVLCVGHHGSSSSTTEPFLREAAPEYAVISCGLNNSYGHPHAKTIEKLEKTGTSLFRTDHQGTVSAFSDGASISWSAEPWEEN